MTVQDGLPTPARYYAMAVIILGLALSVLDGTIVNLALPRIAQDLRASAAESVWIVNAYQVCTLALLLPCATLGDRVGYRRVYLGGLVLFTLASLACALADSLPQLALARAVQGLGAAGIMSVGPALVRLIYPRAWLGRGIAINSTTVAIASVAGPSVAAAILSMAAWPWLFAVNLPLGLLVIVIGWRALPGNPTAPTDGEALSWPDVTLNVMLFAAVFLGLQAVASDTAAAEGVMTLPVGVALLVFGVSVGVVYVRRQLRQERPILPLDLLRMPVFALSVCTSIGAFSAQAVAYIALPFLMLDTYGLSPARAGLLITAWPLAIVLVAPIAGRLIGRFPNGLICGVGLGALAAGLAALALLPERPDDATIIWRLVLCGVGFGLFQPPNNHAIVTSAPLSRTGAASGLLGAARLTGKTVGAVLMAVVFSLAGAHDGRGPVFALAVAAAFAAVAGVASVLRLRYSPSDR